MSSKLEEWRKYEAGRGRNLAQDSFINYKLMMTCDNQCWLGAMGRFVQSSWQILFISLFLMSTQGDAPPLPISQCKVYISSCAKLFWICGVNMHLHCINYTEGVTLWMLWMKKTISHQTLAVLVLKVTLIMPFAVFNFPITSSYSNSDSMLV